MVKSGNVGCNKGYKGWVTYFNRYIYMSDVVVNAVVGKITFMFKSRLESKKLSYVKSVVKLRIAYVVT